IIKTNPSILAATAVKNAALFSKKSAIGSFLPEITGNAGASRSGKSWAPQNNQWNFGAALSMPIFEGGLKLAQLSEAEATYKKAMADEESTRNTAIVNLEQTWASLRDSIENVGVNAQILNATEVRAKISEAQYSTGFISFDNWIIIQNDLVNAKKAYLNAEASALISEANWIQAKGETLEYAQ
ncbi:MAG: TolC family protein, partial [Candidatus Omnitrophica bacterium]|nr:TolC family protein [Candidatus Omnitrophota bacterium]